MTRDEIKFLQMSRQHLCFPATVPAVLHDLCGVQAQFLSYALHALDIRSTGSGEVRLVKSWTLRGTMHVFAQDDLPLFLHKGRKHALRPCDTLEADEAVTAERKAQFAGLIVEKIADGIDEREALKEICFAAGMTEQEAESVFNPWGGTIRALCEEGRICHKVQERKAFQLCPPFWPMEAKEAELELARRYFMHYAPATIRDAAYFFGATQSQVKRWLDELPVSTVSCEGRTYYHIPSEKPAAGDIPPCIFLAGFDPLMLGYQKTDSLYLPREHLRRIFNLAGIVMPAILLHGQVVGKWKRAGHKLTVTPFETLTAADKRLIRESAEKQWPVLRRIEILSI